jgi:hypothetical protein
MAHPAAAAGLAANLLYFKLLTIYGVLSVYGMKKFRRRHGEKFRSAATQSNAF